MMEASIPELSQWPGYLVYRDHKTASKFASIRRLLHTTGAEARFQATTASNEPLGSVHPRAQRHLLK